jgi:hypothetical protein
MQLKTPSVVTPHYVTICIIDSVPKSSFADYSFSFVIRNTVKLVEDINLSYGF